MTMRHRLETARSVIGGGDLQEKVARLEARVDELSAQLQESQSLHQRFAELLDVVTELMVPLAQRDEAAVQATLTKYVDELGS